MMKIIQGDITTLAVDAIVNAGNQRGDGSHLLLLLGA